MYKESDYGLFQGTSDVVFTGTLKMLKATIIFGILAVTPIDNVNSML